MSVREIAPARVLVEETSEGAARGLHVDAPGGERTQVRFRAAPPAEMLDGVAPGEYP